MRLTAKTEYACAALLQLIAHYGDPEPLPIRTIADASGVPQRFLVAILLQLKAAGVVTSLRGPSGGYQLSRPPAQISLAEVLQAVDPESAAPRPPAAETSSTAVHALHSVWREVQAQEGRLLRQITLAEFARRAQEEHALTYQI